MKVRIGSTKYNLILTEENIIVDGDICNGAISGDEEEILIDLKVKENCRLKTFWHECVHGMFHELGLEKLTDDEGLVDSLGRLLYAMHEDNDFNKIYSEVTKMGCKKGKKGGK